MRNRQALRDIHKVIAHTVDKDKPSLSGVANCLGISPRTLQRRISHCKTSFSELVEEVRCQQACKLLQDRQLRIYDVSNILGYANPSSFTRAFDRWMGISPQRYRKQISNQRLSQYQS